METIKIIKPGIYTTIQDLGRFYYQQYGMSVSGAMDEFALRAGNILVGNPENTPALEFNYTGLEVEFLTDAWIAITGGDFLPKASGERVIKCWSSTFIEKGTRLSFPKVIRGCRGYLAVSGGFQVPEVMGSCSTDVRAKVGGFQGRPLKRGDALPVNQINGSIAKKLVPPQLLNKYYPEDAVVRVIKGPQDAMFTQAALTRFFSSQYKITINSNRMGYRLEGPVLEHLGGADIISDGIPKGAIQVPGNGLPLILMSDRQTIGGYAKIANVITVDLPLVAQMKAGSSIGFKEVTIDEAHQLLFEYEKDIETLT